MGRPRAPASTALTVPAVALALVGIGAAAGSAPLLGRANGARDAVLTAGLVGDGVIALVVGAGAAIIVFAARADVRAAVKARRIVVSRSSRIQAIGAVLAIGAVMALLTALVQRRNAAGGSVLPSLDSLLGRGGAHDAGAATPWFFAGLMVLMAVTFVLTVVWLRRVMADVPAADDPEPALRDVAGSARAVLELGDDDRAAVLRAYARMEALLARRGTGRRTVDAPREFLARATAGAPADLREAGARLTALFERARFGAAPVTASDRAAAGEALEVLAAAP